jgi:hypothetical protein
MPGTLAWATDAFLSLAMLGESFALLALALALTEDRENMEDACFVGALTPGLWIQQSKMSIIVSQPRPG